MSNANLAAALDSLTEEEKTLASELVSLQQRQKEVVERLTKVRDAQAAVKALVNGQRIFTLTEPQEVSYAGLTVSEGIAKLLTVEHKPLTAPEIARELLARGFKTTSENFTNLVGVTLRRLKHSRFDQDDQGRWYLVGHQL